MKIIFIGAPGSGKGTQAREFIDKYNYVQLSTGDLLRSAILKGSDIGALVKENMDQGKLIPDEIMISLVKNYLDTQVDKKSIILDGFPRTVIQAESLDSMLSARNDLIDKVIYFKIDPQILIERLVGRRTCILCGEIYHVDIRPSKFNTICDKCGGNIVQRSDDKKEVIVERLIQFEKNTGPAIRYYQSKKVLFEIDGAESTSIVFKKIEKALGLLI